MTMLRSIRAFKVRHAGKPTPLFHYNSTSTMICAVGHGQLLPAENDQSHRRSTAPQQRAGTAHAVDHHHHLPSSCKALDGNRPPRTNHDCWHCVPCVACVVSMTRCSRAAGALLPIRDREGHSPEPHYDLAVRTRWARMCTHRYSSQSKFFAPKPNPGRMCLGGLCAPGGRSPFIHSKAHWFCLLTSSSSSGVKSFLIPKCCGRNRGSSLRLATSQGPRALQSHRRHS